MTSTASPERWARLIDERCPGLAWLSATLAQWSTLLPAERRSWRVTAAANRGGEIQALAALHEERGLLALVAQPDAPTPFFGLPEAVRRIVGEPAVVDRAIDAVPELASRILLTVRRTVHVSAEHLRADDPGLRRAKDDEMLLVDRLRHDSSDPDPLDPVDIAAAAAQGLVWVVEEEGEVAGAFRVAGATPRHVQVEDLIVPPARRGHGLGVRLARAAAQVARNEYSAAAVAAVPDSVAARKTLAAAGYLDTGLLSDVRLR